MWYTYNMKVVHCKKESYDVYIGRPSKWGNPFSIGKDGSREDVIKKYEEYLLGRLDLMKALPELKGKVLGCWCTPQACHGDVLVKYVRALQRFCPYCGFDQFSLWGGEQLICGGCGKEVPYPALDKS